MKILRHYLLTALIAVLATVSAAAQRPVHVVWTTSIEQTSPTEGLIHWSAAIEEGWHIYGMSMPEGSSDLDAPQLTIFTVSPSPAFELTGAVTPSRPADIKFDQSLMLNLPMWEGNVEFTQPFRLQAGHTGATITGSVEYMACTDKACTPPTHDDFNLTFGSPAPADAAVQPDEAATAPAPAPDAVSESDLWAPVAIETTEDGQTPTGESPWWAIFGLGFLGGLVALLTPCVWPMIPMTMSFFLKKGKSRRRAIFDAVAYGLSIIIIYLILGIAITMIFGASKLNAIATSALFNVLFFVLLVVFAVSFFGAFDIKLPSRWSNAVDSKAENTTGLLSIFFMAFTLVLVSFSCTGPIIGTLLVEAASEGAILGPAIGMGGFALGLALPFGLFAFFPSLLKEMPRSGSWLNTVKVVLGFIELILALKFLSVADLAYGWRILDREVFVALWIVLFTLLGLYLLGKLRFSHDSPTEHVSVFRFFLAVASLSFAVYLLPGMWGAPLKSISAFAPPLNTQDFNLYGGTFREFDDYEEGMEYARRTGRPAIVDFSGFACVNCRKMEGAVFDTPEVRAILEDEYVLIKLMVDDKTPLPQPITVEEYGSTTTLRSVGDRWSYLQRHKFGINSQPYYVLLDDDGKPLAPAAAYDENAAKFAQWLTNGVNEYKKSK